MPKTPIRGHAARTVSLHVSLSDIHCRHLDQALQDVGNKARLRASLQPGFLELRPRRHRDSLFRRVLRPEAIGAEKLVVRAALAGAANNLTPTRLGQLGSPGRRAVKVLRDASAADMGRDIRVGQVRGAIAALAGARKKRSFKDTPVKATSSRLAQNGAAALASADSVRRVQLNRFCMDGAASGSLPALLAGKDEPSETVVASLSIFRAAVQSFILEAVLGGKPGPQEPAARQVRKSMDSPLLRLFIALWRRATAAGRLAGGMFPWFDAVDWLVLAMHADRPASPAATRAPQSPRLQSPAALMLRRARTATVPASPATAAPTPGSGRPPRYLRSRTITATGTRPGRAEQPDSPFKAATRPGRGKRNVQPRYQPPRPAPQAASPVMPRATAMCSSPDSDRHARRAAPVPGLAGDCPISPGGHVLPGATLGDIAQHLARHASAASGIETMESDVRAATPGADSSAGELAPGHGQ